MNKIAIVGGGASALVCAIFASKRNDVTIFCDQEILGKKILATGNGRCNLTNLNGFENAYNQDIQNYLNRLSNLDTIQFFNNLGLEIYADEEQRVYPLSNTAQSVVEILTREIKNQNITVINEKVQDVKIGSNIAVCTGSNNYNFDKVVIATGSTNFILDKLNIVYKPFVASLVALKTKQNTKRLSGVRVNNVMVTLKQDNKIYKEFGEVLFKDNGLSGICIFNLSAHLARKNNFSAEIEIDLVPKISLTNLTTILKNRLKLNFKNLNEYMIGLFHKEINKYILKECKLQEDLPLNKIKEKEINKLAQIIKSLKFNIINKYENNQVNSGGVLLQDLTENLQHKRLHNVYFVGEVIDVDGICGGYNLQWAFTSGKIVGENI